MIDWNRVVAIGIKKMGRKYVERIGKIFGDRFMGDKQGEGDKVSGVNWVNDGLIQRGERHNGCVRGFCLIFLTVGMWQGWGKAC